MCDNLGISDEKIGVFDFTYLGQTVTFREKQQLIDWVSDEVEHIDEDDSMEIIITKKMMRESDVENLPEFEGY